MRTLNGEHFSPEQKDWLWNQLEARGWIIDQLDHLWHSRRWCLTPAGFNALDAL